MTRIDRRAFQTRLADSGGQLEVRRIPPRLVRQLERHGVGRDALSRIAGGDHVISGDEFNQLYDALAVRTRGGQRVDAQVSEDLFASLQSRVVRANATPPPQSATNRTVGIGRSANARPSQTVPTAAGEAHIADATDVDGRTDGQRPHWFVAAMESVAEFFVELFGGNFVTSAERDFDVGRQLAEARPETLRAILAEPNGEASLRRQLQSQRPSGTSEQDWNRTVDDVMRGMSRTLAGDAPDLPDNVNPNASLAVRDRAARIYAASPDSRAELSATVDALTASGLSESAQVEALDRWDRTERSSDFRSKLESFNAGLTGRSAGVRSAAIAQLEAHPDRLDSLAATISAPGFTNARLTDDARTDLVRANISDSNAARGLTNVLANEACCNNSAPVRRAMINGVRESADPRAAVGRLQQLAANPGFGRVSADVQQRYVATVLGPNADSASTRAALTRLSGAYEGRLAPLNNVLFGSGTQSRGDQGPEIRATQRYLRALGYDGVMGSVESDTFSPDMERAVRAFQQRSGLLNGQPPAATAGVVDRATFEAMVDAVRAEGIDPGDYRFTTELSLNRPTRSTDGRWRATQRWTPELQEEFGKFAHAYAQARVPRNPGNVSRRPEWSERVDCADLSYEALCQFARQRGLPVYLGSARHSNRGRGRIVYDARMQLGAMHLHQFTRPVRAGESVRTGDIGNMRWNQSRGDGHDSNYWHAHNIVGFDPLFREATVIFGSLDDLVRQRPLDTFNQRGFELTIHDIPEIQIIDGINDDSGQGRQVARPEQEQRVRRLLERHAADGHDVTDADVDAFINMVGTDRNIKRNAPTAVSTRERAFHNLVTGTPWADPTARAAAVQDLNTRFGANFTEADFDRLVAAGDRASVQRVATRLVEQRVPEDRRTGAQDALIDSARGTVRYDANRDALSDPSLRTAAVRSFNATYGARARTRDLQSVLRQGVPGADLVEARRIVARRGVPEDRREEAAQALVDAADSTRRLRRWDFDMFNRNM